MGRKKHAITVCAASRILSGLYRNEGEEGFHAALGDFYSTQDGKISDDPCKVLEYWQSYGCKYVEAAIQEGYSELEQFGITNGDVGDNCPSYGDTITTFLQSIDKILSILQKIENALAGAMGWILLKTPWGRALRVLLVALKGVQLILQALKPILEEARRRDAILRTQCSKIKRIC